MKNHGAKWDEYKSLYVDDSKYFIYIGQDEAQASIHDFMARVLHIDLFIDVGIDVIIIEDILFHPDDIDGVSNIRASALLAPNLDASDAAAGAISWYLIRISNPNQFALVVSYLVAGLSSRQSSVVLYATKTLLGVSMRKCSDSMVSTNARFLCALNLQRMSDLLSKSQMFSIALDMSTHLSVSYCHVRVRLWWRFDVHEFHLISISMHDQHTRFAIFNVTVKFLDAMCSNWSDSIVDVSTDGEKNMTGWLAGVTAGLLNVERPGIMFIW